MKCGKALGVRLRCLVSVSLRDGDAGLGVGCGAMGRVGVCYNAGDMVRTKAVVRGLASAAALAAVAALLAPLLGAALDHHFAERQPDHRHIGLAHSHAHYFHARAYAPAHGHSHAYESAYHPHPVGADGGGEDAPIALRSGGDGAPAAVAASHRNAASDGGHRFSPTSVIGQPPYIALILRAVAPPPLCKPPPLLNRLLSA